MILKIHESKWNTRSFIRLRNFSPFTSRIGVSQSFYPEWPYVEVDSKMRSPLSFCLGGGSGYEDVLLEIAPAGWNLQGIFGGTGIEKFSVSYCRRMNSNLWLWNEQGRASWPSDDSPRVDPGWPRRRPNRELQRGEAVGYLVGSGLVC